MSIMSVPLAHLAETYGQVDIYLFDQMLRGRVSPQASVLDAGCGGGRNLVYLLRQGMSVFGVDEDPAAIGAVRRLAAALAPDLPADNFRVESLESMSFATGSMDVVLSVAVLHFAHDDAHFEAMLQGSWRALRPGGLFFCRLASTIGVEAQLTRRDGRRYLLPDGSERYLVDATRLERLTGALGGELLDPLKTTVVHGQRSMTTWVLRKTPAA
jgi:SAM-dependent methyltransferase